VGIDIKENSLHNMCGFLWYNISRRLLRLGMVKIESIIGKLVSVNTGDHTLKIQLKGDYDVIHVQRAGMRGASHGASNLQDVTTYHYIEALEWEDKMFYEYVGEEVKCRLEDNIVVEIALILPPS